MCLTGQKAAQGFREYGVEPEYADDGFVVLIPAPFNTEEEFLRVERAIEAMPVGAPLTIGRRIPPVSEQAVSPRKAVQMGIVNKTFDVFEKEIVEDVVSTRIPDDWTREDVYE